MGKPNYENLYNITKRLLVEFGFEPVKWSDLLRMPLSESVQISADEREYVFAKIIDKSMIEGKTTVLSTYKLTVRDKAQRQEYALDIVSESDDRRSAWLDMYLPRVLCVRPLKDRELDQYELLLRAVSDNLDLANNTNNTQYFLVKLGLGWW